MDPLATRRRHAHLALAASLCAAGAAAFVLYKFPPSQYSFYPVCPIHQYTGLLCPGCGMTRALSALVRGNLREALHWNPLIVAVLPALIAWAVAAYRSALSPQPQRWPKLPNSVVAALLLLVAAFTLVRNIPI